MDEVVLQPLLLTYSSYECLSLNCQLLRVYLNVLELRRPGSALEGIVGEDALIDVDDFDLESLCSLYSLTDVEKLVSVFRRPIVHLSLTLLDHLESYLVLEVQPPQAGDSYLHLWKLPVEEHTPLL